MNRIYQIELFVVKAFGTVGVVDMDMWQSPTNIIEMSQSAILTRKNT